MSKFCLLGLLTPRIHFLMAVVVFVQKILLRACDLIEQGADVIDLGAESTRPGAKPISVDEEWRRLEPVVSSLSALGVPISVDTYKPEIMRRVLDMGVQWINNVKGHITAELDFLRGYSNVNYIGMHMQGTPEDMQDRPLDGDSVFKAVLQSFERMQNQAMGSR